MRPLVRAVVLVSLSLAALMAAAGWQPGAAPRADAQETDLLDVTSSVVYDVQTAGVPARVTFDVAVFNNDPATDAGNNGDVFYYYALSVPVVRGASGVRAQDAAGRSLSVTVDEPQTGVISRADVSFAAPLFFGDSYSFRLTYDLVDVREPGVLVNANYAFLPIVAMGDSATVTVNTPAGDPWEVSVEARDCQQDGNTFTCSGGDAVFFAALVETSQPAARTSSSFEVPLADKTLTVTLSYFTGEEAVAAHHQQLIAAGLPLIEQAYGFDYDGPDELRISQGGRQSIFGYEGLTGCSGTFCGITISPIADDYTVLHELAHLWSDIFAARWLSEGFAQLLPLEVAPLLPEGLINSPPPERTPATIDLALDEWDDVTNTLSASEETLERIGAGYDYSLRFLEELRFRFGMDTLRAVNRNIAGSGAPADSRRYMDLLEEATGQNLDALFLTWVFPSSDAGLIADRREAKDRLAAARGRLAEAGLSGDLLLSIEEKIKEWKIAEALAALDELEADIDAYAEIAVQLETLAERSAEAGLTLPDTIAEALNRFDFQAARNLLSSASEALDAYVEAQAKVNEPRSLWQKFGLLGSDPEGDLDSARRTFEQGDFTVSRGLAESAADAVDDAGTVALRRLLIVAGILAVLVVALGVAFGISQWRQRELAER